MMAAFIRRFYPAVLVALLVGLSPHSAAFGRLLTSPAERAQLDSQRLNSEGLPAPLQTLQITKARQFISLEGWVSRRNGPASIWLNGQLQDQPSTNTGIEGQNKAGIDVPLSASQGSIRVQPGQLLHLDNAELHDLYLIDAASSKAKPAALGERASQKDGDASSVRISQ
ncbi:hypothetical protein A9Q89_11180 [Gammaproteobacteria bacterium 53_120_T64]|nr:hypothetical protein A9Q89_11180 [Gammaproteobacteria bacterium 53_120_T64]